jgi:hypothetical protein
MGALLVKPRRAKPIGPERTSFIEPLGLEMVAAVCRSTRSAL